MDSWTKTLLWFCAIIAGSLTVYMVYAHQLIRWQKQRGLLARQSWSLYWMIHGFAKKYGWIMAGIVVVAASAAIYTALLSDPIRVHPRQSRAALMDQQLDALRQEEFKGWAQRLEDRRQEFPGEYCGRVSRGITAYERSEEQDALIKMKQSYLVEEYQKFCVR